MKGSKRESLKIGSVAQKLLDSMKRTRTTESFKVGKLGSFWTMIISFIAVFGIIKWGIPFVSRKITGLPFALSIPGTLMLFYMSLTLAAFFIYITFSEERLNEFLEPIKRLLRGDYGIATQYVILGIVPLVVGWQVYDNTVPKMSAPVAIRIQHPSSIFPKALETKQNPLREPDDAEVQKFIEQAKANKVDFVPEAAAEIEKVKGKYENVLGFIPTNAMQAFLKDIKSGNIDKSKARQALIEKYTFEGRILYAMNCRACHGDSTAGDGPMADGFRLRPINFTDNGTIETIVEGYTFWRVSEGGRGLPPEATPWDSAMPVWKPDIPEDYRWRILLAEYDLAQKTPRQPEKEKHEEGPAKK